MDFSFKKDLSKELLLQHHSQETYLEYYLGIPVKKGLFKSPLRNDKSPTCSFYKNKNGDIIFKDFNGSFYGNFISVVMYKYSCTYVQALKQIARDFGIIKSNSSLAISPIKESENKFDKKGPAKIQITKKEFTKEELEWWGKYNITLDILKKFNVYSCENVFLNDTYFAKSDKKNFIFGYYGYKKNGLELWRCYFPFKKDYRFVSNWNATKLQGFEQLPKQGKILVITKSLKDCMSLYSLGIPAIAPCSENLFVTDSVLNILKNKFKHIIVLYDQDRAGKANMAKIRRSHPELHYLVIPKYLESKDFSDLIVNKGITETKKLVKQYLNYFVKQCQEGNQN